MKGVMVVLDGIGDEACSGLGGKTPLEAAGTPNLDWFAAKGKLDYCYTVKKDFVPESHEGVLSLFGYDGLSVGRGALEAMGLGVELKSGDLALRCNFASIDDLKSGMILDRRAGRTLTTKEARVLAKAINEEVKLNGKFKFEFIAGVQHRGALVIRGGFSDNVSDVRQRNGRIVFSKNLDEDDDSQLSAEIINQFVRKSFEVLDKNPVNIIRARKGLYSANVLLCRGAESDKLNFKKLRGNWMALGYMPLEIGIAKALKMEVYKFKYPKLKGIDVYENLYTGLKLAIKNSIKMIKKNKKKIDYFYIHLKESDLPGHDNKPLDKVKMIEMIDLGLFGYLRKILGKGEKLIVTGDHCTACRKKEHTAGAVPLLSWPYDGKERKGQRFTEAWGERGKRFIGRQVLKEKLFIK
jgi:2,3-bisphosphoglycerate-independent phosphoglycerate mutase